MKNKIIFSFLLMLPLMFTSCLKDQEDIFDKSTTQRMDEYLANAKEVLTSQEKGWVMDYYVGDNQKSGGFAYIIKFNGDECTAWSELDRDSVSTSYYSLTTDNGASLSFDTQNYVLHHLATPSSDNYEGSHADFEFTIMSVEPDLVVLKGKKTGSLMQLHPLTMKPTDYLDAVQKMADSVIVGTADGMINGMNVRATFNLDDRQVSFVCPNDTTKHDSCAFTYTDKGIRLYKSIDFAGKPFSSYTYNGETEKLQCADTGNADFVMDCHKPDYWKPVDSFTGDYWWRFYYSSQNRAGKDTLIMDSIKVNVSPLYPNASMYAVTGLSSAFNLTLTYNKSKGCLQFRSQKIGEYSSYDIYMCSLDKAGAFLVSSSEAGVNFVWNTKITDRTVFAGEPIDSDVLRAYGMILWLRASNGGLVSGSEIVSPWLQGAGNNYLMHSAGGTYNYVMGPMSLVKIN